jgi:transposase, IS5 family
MGGQPGFFDVEERLKRLSDLGDQLEAFTRAVDYEQFRPSLDAGLAYADGTKGGRPPLDPVMMFKVLVIQAANGLSDERAEYLINDRLSFMRFLGLGLGDRVPDARTIWLFRERLTRAVIEGRPAIEVLFARFDETLRAAGYIAMSGQILGPSPYPLTYHTMSTGLSLSRRLGQSADSGRARPGRLQGGEGHQGQA